MLLCPALLQVVESELQRVPAHVARRYSSQLWSMVYIPQVFLRGLHFTHITLKRLTIECLQQGPESHSSTIFASSCRDVTCLLPTDTSFMEVCHCAFFTTMQVGFTMCVTGGRLAEELLELLPDYDLAFMGDEGPAAAAAAAGEGFRADTAGSSAAAALCSLGNLSRESLPSSVEHRRSRANSMAATAAAAAAGADLGGQAGDGSCAYYYCECTQQLNSQYGDLQHKIQDLEVGSMLCLQPILCKSKAVGCEVCCGRLKVRIQLPRPGFRLLHCTILIQHHARNLLTHCTTCRKVCLCWCAASDQHLH
jgi:hypothetical protein